MIRTVAMLSSVGGTANNVVQEVGAVSSSRAGGSPSYVREVVSNRMYNLISDYGGHLFSTSGRYACGIKYDTHEGGKSMEMNSVMATEIVAAEVEHIVLPQIVSIKQASRMLGLPPYYLRRFAKRFPAVAFQFRHQVVHQLGGN